MGVGKLYERQAEHSQAERKEPGSNIAPSGPFLSSKPIPVYRKGLLVSWNHWRLP